MLLEERIQYRDSLPAICKVIHAVLRERDERERVECACLNVLGIVGVERLHRGRICLGAIGMGQLRIVPVKRSGCGDVFAFARGLRAGLPGLLDVVPPLNDGSGVRKLPELVVERHGLSPIRHGALPVSLRGVGKCLAGLLVLKRMQKGEALIERGLCLRRT